MVELDSPEDPAPAADLVFRPDLIPWGYFWVFPHGAVLNVGVGSLRGAHAEALRTALDRFIAADPRLRDRKRLRSLGGTIPLRPALRVYRSGVLVAGDAAGMVNPFTGAGIHHALRSGQIAGRACAAALARGSGRCFYGLRLRLSPNYLWLQALSLAGGAVLLLARLLRRPLYVPALRAMMADREMVYRLASRLSRP
jgi:flavin-dependent dehydrogenase